LKGKKVDEEGREKKPTNSGSGGGAKKESMIKAAPRRKCREKRTFRVPTRKSEYGFLPVTFRRS